MSARPYELAVAKLALFFESTLLKWLFPLTQVTGKVAE